LIRLDASAIPTRAHFEPSRSCFNSPAYLFSQGSFLYGASDHKKKPHVETTKTLAISNERHRKSRTRSRQQTRREKEGKKIDFNLFKISTCTEMVAPSTARKQPLVVALAKSNNKATTTLVRCELLISPACFVVLDPLSLCRLLSNT
jgi:hypothetical protein